jgi:hypothetical protein
MQRHISTNKVGIREIQPKSWILETPEMKLAAASSTDPFAWLRWEAAIAGLS